HSIRAAGVAFSNGYVTCPVCSPTRAGLLTGKYQQRFGHEFNPGPPAAANENFGLHLRETPLPLLLKKQGYATGMVGKWHLGYKKPLRPLDLGFGDFYGFLGGPPPSVDSNADPTNPIYRANEPIEETESPPAAFGREAVAYIDRHKAE